MNNICEYRDLHNRLGTKILKLEESLSASGIKTVISASFKKLVNGEKATDDDLLAGNYDKGYPASKLAKVYFFNSNGNIILKPTKAIETAIDDIFKEEEYTVEKDGKIVFRSI